MKKTLLIIFIFILSITGTSQSYENHEPLNVTISSELENPSAVFFYIGPTVGYKTKNLSLGIRSKFEITDLFNFLSVDFGGQLNFLNTLQTNERIHYTNYSGDQATFEIEAGAGFRLKRWNAKVNQRLHLKTENHIDYYTEVPGVRIKRLEARIGIGYGTRLFAGNVKNTYFEEINNGVIFNDTLVSGLGQFKSSELILQFGFKWRVSQSTTYLVEDYGEIIANKEHYLYLDGLYNMSKKFSNVVENKYNQSSDEVIYSRNLTNFGLTALEDGMKFLPIGFRLGASFATSKLHGIGINIEAGVYPGFYDVFGNTISVNATVHYRLKYRSPRVMKYYSIE